ncbi:NAD-dependent succinate-semialdehyde dehydrogenase [Zeaxanthinibacter enoshimensis]|uniref:Succinate-semialdehyde dehydrogenase/glutarate-semialdehyde dehydrogenase n=1 Tax=Zeaxanthinibacter enoshimensis TaxID=392009 RepID=A0A4R6TKQ9_9FLAO|nr:NAD-dependent succinate-semialdehyde dehydrogenase [Zeaxanthinibacter enoshimensis]TDQ31426.1 succinate-semialdehyde dehydrogenase/glutarate-semialdehyde dehydrogenase [Zeaxanthinibacter enoshimensis]
MKKSVNPYNNKVLYEFEELSEKDIKEFIKRADQAARKWKKESFPDRSALLLKAAAELEKNKQEYARTICEEMGKPISQAIAEIEKCTWVCEYYAENAADHLSDELIETDAGKSYVRYEPLGVVLAIMPWNYPFWQVFRFAAPALMAGNVGLLKHASNVMKSAEMISRVFRRAGFPEGCFQHLVVGSDAIETILKDPVVKAVTLTGSKPAGSSVAAIAGKEIKKSVLELGGSNALVVFEDAELDSAIDTCIQARFQNTGQSCIAGKRLLLHEAVADDFTKAFLEKVKNLQSGDPADQDTYIGVMAREDLAKELEQQVKDSEAMGAVILTGGRREGAYFEPTVLDRVSEDMPLFKEETFGPAIGITRFKDENEAVQLSNATEFGLGVSLFTQDRERAERLIPLFDEGAVFINELVKSDPRLPFGGVNTSGYGRELSHHGIQEFVNKKTVYINM